MRTSELHPHFAVLVFYTLLGFMALKLPLTLWGVLHSLFNWEATQDLSFEVVWIVQLKSCPVFPTLEKAYQNTVTFCPRQQMGDECPALHDRWCCTLQRVQEIWTGRLIGVGGLSKVLSDHSQLSCGLPHATELSCLSIYFSGCLPHCCYIPCHNSCPSLGLRSVLCVNVSNCKWHSEI